jgi:hypothetical protein
MTDGSITQNEAIAYSANSSSCGGGIAINSGTFTMKGGNIGDSDDSLLANKAKHGGAVYIDTSGIFEIEDGDISGNTADLGNGVYDGSTNKDFAQWYYNEGGREGAGSGIEDDVYPDLSGPVVYEIGDDGPAGGIIFAIGTDADSWDYMEVTKTDIGSEEAGYIWGNQSWGVQGTETGMGTGKNNTDLIVENDTTSPDVDTAARLCNDHEQNGFEDWFLPSKDELTKIHTELLDVSGAGLHSFYWSSSQGTDPSEAWWQRFLLEVDIPDSNWKDGYAFVRAGHVGARH